MRFLADENVEQPIVGSLRQAGHAVTYVCELAPGASDERVLELAQRESRVLLTNDKDFGEMAYRRRCLSAGAVLLRLSSQDGLRKASLWA